jgi:hypothetical protein
VTDFMAIDQPASRRGAHGWQYVERLREKQRRQGLVSESGILPLLGL